MGGDRPISHHRHTEARNPYGRFAIMILASTLLMYGLMYLNTYEPAHAWFSQTRMWMAVLMGAAMAILMLGFMWRMYPDRVANWTILGLAAAAFGVSLFLVRSQALVDDRAYMEAMIPHHSIAVLTSSRAHIRDPRVRELADGILETQLREIGQMERLVADLRAHPVPDNAPDLPLRVIP
jgi:hypothetical protein